MPRNAFFSQIFSSSSNVSPGGGGSRTSPTITKDKTDLSSIRVTPTDSPFTPQERATPANLSASLPASFASRSPHETAPTREEPHSGWDADAFPPFSISVSSSSPPSKWTLARSKRSHIAPPDSSVQVPFPTSHSLAEGRGRGKEGGIHAFRSTPTKDGERPSMPLFSAARESTTKQKAPHYQLSRLSREAQARASTPSMSVKAATVAEVQCTPGQQQQQSTPRKKLQRCRSRANSLALLFYPTASSRKDSSSSSSSSSSGAVSNTISGEEDVDPPYTPSRKALDEDRDFSNTSESRGRRYDELHHLISLIEGSSGGQCSPRAFPAPIDTRQMRVGTCSPDMCTPSGRRNVGGQHRRLYEPEMGSTATQRCAEPAAVRRERGRSGSLLFGLFRPGSPMLPIKDGGDMDHIDRLHLDTPSKKRTLRTRASLPFLSLRSALTAPLYIRENSLSVTESPDRIDDVALGSGRREGWYEDPLRLSLGMEGVGTTFHEEKWAEFVFPPLLPSAEHHAEGSGKRSLRYKPAGGDWQEEEPSLPACLAGGEGTRTSTPPPVLVTKTVLSRSVGASYTPSAQLYPSERTRSRHATIETFLSSSPSSEAEETLRPLSSRSSLLGSSLIAPGAGGARGESTLMFDLETSDDRLIRELIDAFPSPKSWEEPVNSEAQVETEAETRSPASMLTFDDDDEAMSPAFQDDGEDLRTPKEAQGEEGFQYQAGVTTFETIYARDVEEEDGEDEPTMRLRRFTAVSIANAGTCAREAHPCDEEPKIPFAPSTARKLLRQLSLRRRPSSSGSLFPSSSIRRRNSSLTTQGSLSTIASSGGEGGRESLAFSPCTSDGQGGWRDDDDEEEEEECSTPFYLEDDQVYWPQILEH